MENIIDKISSEYKVFRLKERDVDDIYNLCLGNPSYYKYCPPTVTKQLILDDMVALPPKKSMNDKYYVGFYDGEKLVAVMDLVFGYPNNQTAFIGFFMVDCKYQNKGVGCKIIKDLKTFLKNMGYKYIRLAYVKDNPQSKYFWQKCGFLPSGNEVVKQKYTVIPMQYSL